MTVHTLRGVRALARGTNVVAYATALALVGLAAGASVASAATITLTNQYNVAFTPVALPGGSYKYTFSVTNATQGPGAAVGLDGFYVGIPHGAHVSSVVAPPPYVSGGGASWGTLAQVQNTLDPTQDWFKFWGSGNNSVYQLHSTATFSFVTDSVLSGDVPIYLVTYWGPSLATYSSYQGAAAMPVGVPEPASLGVLALGGLALLTARRRKV